MKTFDKSTRPLPALSAVPHPNWDSLPLSTSDSRSCMFLPVTMEGYNITQASVTPENKILKASTPSVSLATPSDTLPRPPAKQRHRTHSEKWLVQKQFTNRGLWSLLGSLAWISLSRPLHLTCRGGMGIFFFLLLFLEVSRISSVVPFNHKPGATLICGILIWNRQLHDIENAYHTYSV